MTALNSAFQPAFISFTLRNTVWAINDNWGASRDTDTMQRELREGDKKTLNLYFLEDLTSGDTRILGLARLPNALRAPDALARDGCLVHVDTLPGGRFRNKNSGKTTIHEVGHWLGLLHTFDGGCGGRGDGVGDTPATSQPSFDCRPRDSCPGQPGQDAVDNFMDYGLEYVVQLFQVAVS